MYLWNNEGNENPTTTYDIEKWKQGMEEGCSQKGSKKGWLITGLSRQTLILSILVEVVAGTKGKETRVF